MPLQEKNYNIFQNEEDELAIVIRARDGEPDKNCKLVYDGGEHALFFRNHHETILLDYLNSPVQPVLAASDEILIVELDSAEIVREYDVPVRHVVALPVDTTKIEPMDAPSQGDIMVQVEDYMNIDSV